MTKPEMVTFISELTESVKETIIGKILSDKVPEDWDGHELRQLLADYFKANTTKLAPQRKRDYNRAVISRGL